MISPKPTVLVVVAEETSNCPLMVSPVLLTYVPDPPPKFPVAVPVRTISPTVSVDIWMFPVVGVSVMTIEPSEI
jgi:hypothetical protein